jgi:hypothetical protein
MHRNDSVENWLDGLWLDLLALAIAGSASLNPQVNGVPLVEVRGSESSQFILVPLGTIMRYHWRCKEASSRVPSANRFSWLKTRCTDERTIWQERHRESHRPLGQIIVEVFKEREPIWWNCPIGQGASSGGDPKLKNRIDELERQNANLLKEKGGAAKGEGARGGSDTNKKHLKTQDDRGSGKNVIIFKTSGGKDLCKDFQFSKCKNGKDCSNGQHKCGGVMPGSDGKVCNMPGHSGIDCKRCKKGSA